MRITSHRSDHTRQAPKRAQQLRSEYGLLLPLGHDRAFLPLCCWQCNWGLPLNLLFKWCNARTRKSSAAIWCFSALEHHLFLLISLLWWLAASNYILCTYRNAGTGQCMGRMRTAHTSFKNVLFDQVRRIMSCKALGVPAVLMIQNGFVTVISITLQTGHSNFGPVSGVCLCTVLQGFRFKLMF